MAVGSPASARVGVTSAADGDPLGKPPNENERILRIGIDVQANELITTSATDRAHLVFLDGSSLTVGPDARLTIDKFVYDPNTQKGELAINASKGVFRLVGGKISKSAPITITTPSSTIGIRGGITIVSVTQVQTIAGFVFGINMTVTAAGQTTTASRAETLVTTIAGAAPGALTSFKQGGGGLLAALSQLEGASPSNNNGADQSAQKSGFSSKNSGQPANTSANNQNQPPNSTNNTLTNAVSNTNPAGQPLGNSTTQSQLKTNTVSTTIIPINNPTAPNNTPTNDPTAPNSTPTNNPAAPNNTPTNNPTPPPSGPTTTTRTASAPGLVVIDRPGDDHDHHSRRMRVLSQQGTASITTDSANNQANGTIVVGVNGATATLPLSGTRNGTSVAMTNDPSRPSTLQIGDHTYQINPTTTLASASNPACTCEFLSWGKWTSSVPDPRDNGNTLTARGTYVAGTPSVQLPTTGSATYNGFMAGYASHHGQINYATGTYQNVWNFQNRNGAFTGSFDGRNYAGTMQTTGPTGTTTFAGTINSTSGHHRSGSMSGGFFSSPTNPSAYQAGTFSIGNGSSRYQATGIFAGQR